MRSPYLPYRHIRAILASKNSPGRIAGTGSTAYPIENTGHKSQMGWLGGIFPAIENLSGTARNSPLRGRLR
jgi:hypothetical protein